jgi:hypothetical protein
MIREFILDLEHRLSELPLKNIPRWMGSKRIRELIRKTCEDHDYQCIFSYPAGLITSDRRGFIECVCYAGPKSAEELTAIEVDATNKQWSLEKLLVMKQRGFTPVWIRWNAVTTIPIPEDVFCINLTAEPLPSPHVKAGGAE